MIRDLASMYRPGYARVLVYMLQGSEYRVGPYLRWLHRTKDFSRVMQRRVLEPTRPARLLLTALRCGMLLQVAIGIVLMYAGIRHDVPGGAAFGAAAIISYPVVWAYLVLAPLILGRHLSTQPQEQKAINRSEVIFANHPGVKIAVAGSYGKTTMKELLDTVLSEGLKVVATPGNKNVSISHARFAAKLTGKEDVLIIEYGEGEPGDVARFARLTHPSHAIITGLTAAHLDRYKTIQAAGEDIFAVADYLKGKHVYVNDEPEDIKPFLKDPYELFNQKGALGWSVTSVKTSLEGTSFILKKGGKSLSLTSGLLGGHHLGFLALVAGLALELGLSEKQVQAGIAKTKPFEHRMQPYPLAGAWVIDDT
ncbi:MAG TPA: Mur ligase family protein, partial [Candidatus Saccharimonadales bacterium]|nr:Mur ligase family protein [Candidatus Saccharimonadales bacterium]